MSPPKKRSRGGPPKGGGRGAPKRSARRAAPAGKPARASASPARSATSGGSGGKGRAAAADRRAGVARGLGGDQVEGRQAVRELLLAGARRVHEISIEADLAAADILEDIAELAADQRVPLQVVAAGKLRSMAKTDAPQGVVARAQPLTEVDLDELAQAPKGAPRPFLLAFDGVTDPGNLGAALRSAEGAGVTGVILPRHRAVHITPTVAKAAAGAIEYLPMAVVGGIPAAIERLQKLGVWVVGLDAGGDRTVHELDLGSEPIALVLGAEGQGLSRLVRQRCDGLARIPLGGQLASLNVSAAAAVACFEVRRQRGGR